MPFGPSAVDRAGTVQRLVLTFEEIENNATNLTG
jgi:hypothetical protein